MNLLFECYSGSKLYGTNSPSSDTDIKGVFLPELDDLILCKAPKVYTSTSSQKGERNNADDIDKTYYSLQYFLELACRGDTNALDLLFAVSNEKAVIYKSPIWDELIKNSSRIITKNVNAYLGYCKSQCVKYSIKGDKLISYQAFYDFLTQKMNFKNEFGSYISLEEALKNSFDLSFENGKDYEKNGKVIGVRYKQTKFKDFGDHCYIIRIASNKEYELMISDMRFSFNEDVKDVRSKVTRIINSYGKRAEQAAEKSGADWKAISHCVRVLFQVEELLTTSKITFPLKEAEFIKSIKYNNGKKYSYEYIMNFIEEKIKYIDEVLLPNSTLPSKADFKWVNQFILDAYKK